MGQIQRLPGRNAGALDARQRDWASTTRPPGGDSAHSSDPGHGHLPERCRRINLGYLDPASVNPEEWEGREDEGVLVVPRAGEMLYRVQDGQPNSPE